MTNITVSDRSIINSYPLQSSEINKTVDNDIIKGHEPARSIIALVSQPGVMASILHGQSLVASSDSRPLLSVPSIGPDKINSQQADRLLKLTATMNGGDINQLERAAASAATVFTASTSPVQVNGKMLNSTKSIVGTVALSTGNVSSQHQQRSHAAVEGGTDITHVEAAQHQFVNIMGDMKMVMLNNQLTVTLTKSEADAAKASSKSTIRVVEAAERAGTKIINAEKQRFNGAITSGTVGVIGQAATSAGSLKAMHKESVSINENLKPAALGECSKTQHISDLKTRPDNMISKGESYDENASAHSTSAHPQNEASTAQKTNTHSEIQVGSHKMRVISDYGNQTVNATKGIIEGSYNVEAANETKQSELARADQTVNSEVANTQQQTAKKAADAKASLQQIFENTLNNNNSAVSAVADRIR